MRENSSGCLVRREWEDLFWWGPDIFHPSPPKIYHWHEKSIAYPITKLPQFCESHLHSSNTLKTYQISLSLLVFCSFYTTSTMWNNDKSRFVLCQFFFSSSNITYIILYITSLITRTLGMQWVSFLFFYFGCYNV